MTDIAKLSPRERQVVALKRSFYETKEIAAQLGISTHTVFSNLDKARHKFSACSMGELLRRAKLQGL